MYYEYQRWYDPSIGRFISEDPLAGHLSNPQSLNPFVYVQDSPTSSVDPTGMADCGLSLGGALGCLENFGGAVANGWNSQPDWAKYTEIGVGVAAAIILTAGIAAPELLVLVPPLLVGDIGAGAGTAGVCEEDPAACDPIPPPPTGPNVCECPVIGDANPGLSESGGPGGVLPNALGSQAEGQFLFDNLLANGANPQDIAPQQSFTLRTGENVRPDFVVSEGPFRGIYEIKGGYASGTRLLGQAANYDQLGQELNMPVFYRLNAGGSRPFLDFLARLHIPTI